jgi:hypothetical protein
VCERWYTRTLCVLRIRNTRHGHPTPDGQHAIADRDGAPTGVLVHVRTTTGQGENTTMKSSRSGQGHLRSFGGNPTRPSKAQRAARQQSGPTHAREHSCVWRFCSETTTIPLTPPILCVTVWDRRNLALWRASARDSGISKAFRYQSLNELTVRRAHPVCLQLDRSPDPGRQGRALTKRAVLYIFETSDTCFRPF